MRFLVMSLTLLCLGLASPAQAGPITFSYTSGQFTNLPSVFPQAGITALTALFTVPELPASVTDYIAPITLLSMTDGLNSVDGNYQITSKFSTNEFAEITDIYLAASRQQPIGTFPVGTNVSMFIRQNPLVDWMGVAEITYCWNSDNSGAFCNDSHYFPAGGVATITQVTPVPEPATLSLLAGGIAFVAAARRRSKKRAIAA